MKHELDIRVYYEDTDAGGIVYHANYLNFGERGRTEFLRHIGFQNSEVHHKMGVMFVVRHIDINYLKPAMLDDALVLETTVSEIKNSSIVMRQITRKNDEALADMHVVLVCVDTKTYRPTRVPEEIRESFRQYLVIESE